MTRKGQIQFRTNLSNKMLFKNNLIEVVQDFCFTISRMLQLYYKIKDITF
ncbi:hypothetical protein pb186bvf_001882 [Paramecium bursaria]